MNKAQKTVMNLVQYDKKIQRNNFFQFNTLKIVRNVLQYKSMSVRIIFPYGILYAAVTAYSL